MFKNLQRYNFLANHNGDGYYVHSFLMFKNLQRYNFLANHNSKYSFSFSSSDV